MFSLNRAMLIGNLTRDPELRYTPSGSQVASFGLATNRRWTGQDGAEQNATDFHDIVAWGKLAEIVSQLLKKGQPAYVEGRIQTRNWEAPDGSKRYKTEIIAENVIALSKRSESGAPSLPPEEMGSEKPAAAPKSAQEKPEAKKEDKLNDEVTIEDLDEIPF